MHEQTRTEKRPRGIIPSGVSPCRTLRLSGGHKTAHPFPFHRACINRAIALVAKGELPLQTKATEGARDILAAVHAKFYAARAALQAEALQTATATDDDAWSAELERRARVGRR